MSKVNLTELKRKAAASTFSSLTTELDPVAYRSVIYITSEQSESIGELIPGRIICSHETAINAEFIAAANPQTILTLLEVIRVQQEALLGAKKSITELAEFTHTTECFSGDHTEKECVDESTNEVDKALSQISKLVSFEDETN